MKWDWPWEFLTTEQPIFIRQDWQRETWETRKWTTLIPEFFTCTKFISLICYWTKFSQNLGILESTPELTMVKINTFGRVRSNLGSQKQGLILSHLSKNDDMRKNSTASKKLWKYIKQITFAFYSYIKLYSCLIILYISSYLTYPFLIGSKNWQHFILKPINPSTNMFGANNSFRSMNDYLVTMQDFDRGVTSDSVLDLYGPYHLYQAAVVEFHQCIPCRYCGMQSGHLW